MCAFHHSPQIVTNGLVLYLDPANTKSYPGTGTVWNDLSGNAFNAISQASAGNTESAWNSAGYFNLTEGLDVFFLVSGLNNYNFVNGISIDYTIKNTGGDYRAIIENSAYGSSDYKVAVRFGREDYYGGANNGTSTSFKINGNAVSYPTELNVWKHIHCIYDMVNISVYIDGVFFDSTAYTTPIIQAPYDFRFFRHFNTGEDLVNPISNIKIYNRALTQSEITQNYNALKGRFQ
jgi:hypothetical protein